MGLGSDQLASEKLACMCILCLTNSVKNKVEIHPIIGSFEKTKKRIKKRIIVSCKLNKMYFLSIYLL